MFYQLIPSPDEPAVLVELSCNPDVLTIVFFLSIIDSVHWIRNKVTNTLQVIRCNVE